MAAVDELSGKSSQTYKKTWMGGYVVLKKGKPLFIIRKSFGGQRLVRSTGCSTERGALEQLALFEKNPLAYLPPSGREVDNGVDNAIRITQALVTEYVTWMVTPKPAGKGGGRPWARDCGRYLRDWLVDTKGADLRTLTAPKLKALTIARGTNVMHRIEAIKGFASWLRAEKALLSRADDPTLDLKVPNKDRDEALIQKRARPPEDMLKLYKYMPTEVARHVLVFQLGTGCHISEVRRFSANGWLEDDPSGQYLATAITRHKGGKRHPMGLQHARHLEAAKFLLANYVPGYTGLQKQFRAAVKACEAAIAKGEETPPSLPYEEGFGFGSCRHVVGSFALMQNAAEEAVAASLGHRSTEMLKKHYAMRTLAPKPIPIPSLDGLEPSSVH